MTLSFALEAKRHFDPVAQQFGLTFAASNERVVRYENDKVFLEVDFDNGRSFELGVEIGKKDVRYPGPPFSLAEILRLRGIQDTAAAYALMASDETRVQTTLARLAGLTADHAADFLMGSDFSFAQVEKLRNKESAEFELASQLRHARSAVETAWSVRDYATVVKVLTPLENHLSPAEEKRLDYSRKQLAP